MQPRTIVNLTWSPEGVAEAPQGGRYVLHSHAEPDGEVMVWPVYYAPPGSISHAVLMPAGAMTREKAQRAARQHAAYSVEREAAAQ